jgi:hypothetical protein
MRLVGILLVIFGVVLLVYGGITLFIPSDEMTLGNFSLRINENMVVPMPPILGLISLIVGIVMILSAPVYYPPPRDYY